jgi:glycine/D-amino acid oxidase-like deaminating enzyme
MTLQTTDFLIIGGWIIGISIALEAKQRFPDCRVTLLEKESHCDLHASGRTAVYCMPDSTTAPTVSRRDVPAMETGSGPRIAGSVGCVSTPEENWWWQ